MGRYPLNSMVLWNGALKRSTVMCIFRTVLHLDATFPRRRLGFEPGSGYVGFVVDQAPLGQVFLEYFSFSCQAFYRFTLITIITIIRCSYSRPNSGPLAEWTQSYSIPRKLQYITRHKWINYIFDWTGLFVILSLSFPFSLFLPSCIHCLYYLCFICSFRCKKKTTFFMHIIGVLINI
jgi:hypothetical protein